MHDLRGGGRPSRLCREERKGTLSCTRDPSKNKEGKKHTEHTQNKKLRDLY